MGNELIREADIAPPPLFSGDSGRKLSVRDIVDTLFRQKETILVLWSLVLVSTLAYIFLTPRLYESEMTILVKDKRMEPVATSEGVERPETVVSDAQLATEIQLLSSRELFRMVAVKNGMANGSNQAQLEKAAARLKKEIHINPILKSRLIQLKYSDTDAKRSAAVLQSLSAFYMDMHLELHRSPGSFDFFSRQASEYEQQLRKAQEKLREFQDKRRIVLLPEQKDQGLRKLMEMESALRDAQSQRAEVQLRAAKLSEQLNVLGGRINKPVRHTTNQSSLERLNAELTELQNKKAELLQRFYADDRMVKQVEQEIADTRQAIESAMSITSTEEATELNPMRQSVEGELARAEVNITGLTARISALSSQLGELRAQLNRLSVAASDDQLLLHEVSVAEQNFVLYSRKREEARITQEIDRNKFANVAVVDPPRAPAFAKSILGSGVPAAFLLGSFLVLALGFAIGHRRNVVYTPWELESNTGLPVLATIPLQGGPLFATEPMVGGPKLLEAAEEDFKEYRTR